MGRRGTTTTITLLNGSVREDPNTTIPRTSRSQDQGQDPGTAPRGPATKTSHGITAPIKQPKKIEVEVEVEVEIPPPPLPLIPLTRFPPLLDPGQQKPTPPDEVGGSDGAHTRRTSMHTSPPPTTLLSTSTQT
jgi:hypothetical protein